MLGEMPDSSVGAEVVEGGEGFMDCGCRGGEAGVKV